MNATPMTPWATARMVAVDSTANSPPRAIPAIRSKIARLARLPASPKAMMIPAMTKEARNLSSPVPMPATTATPFLARSAIWGCIFCSSAGRSACALDQIAYTFLPTRGHSATSGVRRGDLHVLSCSCPTASCMESPSEFTSTLVGPTISTMPRITIRVAASPCLPPSFAANIRCSGYSVTARISAQTIRDRNGEKIR